MHDELLMAVPAAVEVVEVGLRDGLQTVPEGLPTATKLRIVDLLLEAGVRRIEVASFAHPAVLPQFADAERLLATVPRLAGVEYRGFAPNLRGAARAVSCGVDELVFLLSTSDEANRGNQGRSTDRLLDEIAEAAELARGAGVRMTVGVALAFFAPGVGRVPDAVLDGVVDRVVGAGANGVYLADSLGMADPIHVHAATLRTRRAHPGTAIGLHLHTRNGFAMANVWAGLMAGADWLESAFAGLGGDAWLPGDPDVLGNLATEDLMAFLSRLGVAHGIDRAAFAAVTDAVVTATGRRSLDHVTRGGDESALAALDWAEMMRNFDGVTTTRGKASR